MHPGSLHAFSVLPKTVPNNALIFLYGIALKAIFVLKFN